jgi:large subunit ribosomal protein LP0
MGGKTGTKAVYFDKLKGLLDEYKSIFIVRSSQGCVDTAH